MVPVQVSEALGTDGRPAVASPLGQGPLSGLRLLTWPQPPARMLFFIHHLMGLPAVPGPPSRWAQSLPCRTP